MTRPTVALTPAARDVRLRPWTAPNNLAELGAHVTCETCETPLINQICPRCLEEDADEQRRYEAARDGRWGRD